MTEDTTRDATGCRACDESDTDCPEHSAPWLAQQLEDAYANEPTMTGCDACKDGRHADCTAADGDCTNTCHPNQPADYTNQTASHPDHDGLRAESLDRWYCDACDSAAVESAIARGRDEIAADIASGRIPPTVSTFAQLHDHVDANEYAGLTDESGPLAWFDVDETDPRREQLQALANDVQGGLAGYVESLAARYTTGGTFGSPRLGRQSRHVAGVCEACVGDIPPGSAVIRQPWESGPADLTYHVSCPARPAAPTR